MRIEQTAWTEKGNWQPKNPGGMAGDAHLVFALGATDRLGAPGRLDEIRAAYPNAYIMGCSTSGEIFGTQVLDDSLVVTAVHFDHTSLRAAEVRLADVDGSFAAGRQLARALDPSGLAHVLILSDGLCVNGSELVKGLTAHLPPGVAVTGGLSGDGARFSRTLVATSAHPESGKIAAIGFYGERLKVGYGSRGGWDGFGPARIVTKSSNNILHELDGQSGLELYKKYLGEHAQGLPASGLLFPLTIQRQGNQSLVRTILAVDEAGQTMTFAGDIPQGCHARLMRANFERLIEGASDAASISAEDFGSGGPELALLISCVGRKLVLKQRIEEEVEAVGQVLGRNTVLAGFYSYGEVCPMGPDSQSELHNQTMTITTFAEF